MLPRMKVLMLPKSRPAQRWRSQLSIGIFFSWFSTLRVQADFKSKGIFQEKREGFSCVPRGSLLDSRVAGDLAISDVARVFGLRASAIRYYEQIGILPPPMRKNGQRRYDNSALFRLAVVQRARETGFTLEEIRELFFGFPPGTAPPKRWHQLSQRKIAELRDRMKRLKLMETLLKRVEDCRCDALDECGEKILRKDQG
jgi:MerR family transcriptional regulator, redox-sensitive transcriptional activator SoxR